MSLYRRYGVSCDQCAAVVGGHASSRSARAAARKAGWTREKGSPSEGRDYCPRCTRTNGTTTTVTTTRGLL